LGLVVWGWTNSKYGFIPATLPPLNYRQGWSIKRKTIVAPINEHPPLPKPTSWW
jgi:hypothetical protein